MPVRRDFSSKFDRKRGFDREAARKTVVFRQPQAPYFMYGAFSYAGEILRTDVRFYSENIRQIAEK